SRGHLEQAIELDSRFAAAHAELAHVFLWLVIFGVMPAREGLALGRREAERALALEPSLPDGHAMLASVAAMFEYDWQEAERRFRFALEQESAPVFVHRYYATYCLLPLGRAREAIEHHELVFAEDPLNLSARSERALALYAGGRPTDAEMELQRILELDETFWFPYFILGQAQALQGQNDEALRLTERAHREAPWFLPAVAVLAVVLERTGDHARAGALAQRLRPNSGHVDPIGAATFHLLRG